MTRSLFSACYAVLLLHCLSAPMASAGFGDLLKKIEETIPSTGNNASTTTATDTTLDVATLSAGLKDALRVGTERAVTQLATTDGFLSNPKVHIPLPASIQQAASLLDRFGLGSLREQLEVSMNRAAEQAVPAATAHLKAALEAMTIDDALRIFKGKEDAATRYFEANSAQQIGTDFAPIIREAMDQVGVSRYYQQLLKEAKRYPLVGSLNLDLEQHVTQAAVEGLFTTLAEQEALIRRDPMARTTDLLKQVFGSP